MSEVGGAKNVNDAAPQVAHEAWLELDGAGSALRDEHAPAQDAPASQVPTAPEIDHSLMQGLQFAHLPEISQQATIKLFDQLLGPLGDLGKAGPIAIADPPRPTRDLSALADRIVKELEAESDAGLTRTIGNFTRTLRRENQQDLDALVGELGKRGALDDLSRELAIEGKDARRRGLTAQFNALTSFDKAVKTHGTPETREAWAGARDKLHALPATAINDGRLAGRESSDGVKNALDRKDRKLLEMTARDLVRSFPSGKSHQRPLFATNKLNTAIRTLASEGKLDDLLRELRGSKHGQKLFRSLDKKVAKYGNDDTRGLLKAFEQSAHGKATIPSAPRRVPAARLGSRPAPSAGGGATVRTPSPRASPPPR